MLFYGRSKFTSLTAFIKFHDLDDIEYVMSTLYARKCIKFYLKDCGLMEDVIGLSNTLKNFDLVRTEFTGRHGLDPLDCDSLMDESEACEEILKLAMAEYLRIDQVFTGIFLDGFYQDLHLIIEDLKVIKEIYDQPFDKEEMYKYKCNIF